MSNLFVLVQDGIKGGDVTIIGIAVAVFVVLMTILLLLFRRGSSKKQGVLLVGLSDGGKTLIYSRLVDKRYVNTHTSVKENTGDYISTSKRNLKIIDLPGYQRIRFSFLDKYKAQARAIIFVVDSLTVTKDIKEVGEFLYTLLSDNTIRKSVPDILIACSKHDQALAKGAQIIKANIEKELNTVRKTKHATLVGTDDSTANNIFLGRNDKDFAFSDLKSNRVEFVECSAKSNGDGNVADMAGIVDWLEKIA